MTEQAWWVVAIVVVIVVGVVSFFIGRKFGAEKDRIEELESEVSRHKAEISTYKQEVESHFDKTATLFVSMAGSYKDLFEHLSSGYEKLADGSAREPFKQRVSSLLLDGAKGGKDSSALLTSGVSATAAQEDASAGKLDKGAEKSLDAGIEAQSGTSTASDVDDESSALATAGKGQVASKIETPKAETPKAETPKAETPKAETAKAETAKAETANAGSHPSAGSKQVPGDEDRVAVKSAQESAKQPTETERRGDDTK